ncbi:MAG: sensor domain-containing diguanylate cyclase [Candidatus Omnitrophica bacterium]|nr:sensor domain-containing diguanylate cyclase [Candidatus Omnitrophota bacterium]
MRCLVLLIVVNLIFIGAILEVVKTGNYSFLFNLSIIPVIAACVFLSSLEAIILITISSLLAVSFILLGVSHIFVIQTTVFLALSGMLAYQLRWVTEHTIVSKGRVLDVIKEENRSAYEFNEKTQSAKLQLEKSVYDISSLYQAPKKMADSATLEELISSLVKTIEEYFSFKKCKLIIFSFKDKDKKIEKIYNIPEVEPKEAPNGYENQLIDILRNRKTPLVIDKAAGILPQEGLNLPTGIETFLAVPLNVGEKYNGIFTVEEFSLDDLVRFMILAHQFALVLERIRLYELVHELAITDGLTDVFVRRHFLARLNEELERAKYFNARLSFLMIDIDHFKMCNDKYGHLVGDIVLKKIANILKQNLREIDIIGRYGGEEFSVMLPETTKEGAIMVAERLRKAVEATEVKAYDETINTTISAGISTFPDDTDELNQLVDKSDQMLYKAKAEGRNKVVVYG